MKTKGQSGWVFALLLPACAIVSSTGVAHADSGSSAVSVGKHYVAVFTGSLSPYESLQVGDTVSASALLADLEDSSVQGLDGDSSGSVSGAKGGLDAFATGNYGSSGTPYTGNDQDAAETASNDYDPSVDDDPICPNVASGVADDDLTAAELATLLEEQVTCGKESPDAVVGDWQDYEGHTVIMRQGYYDADKDRGFGLEKVSVKHNLTLQSVKYSTQEVTGPREPSGATAYNYFSEVQLLSCPEDEVTAGVSNNPDECEVVDTVHIKTTADFRQIDFDGRQKGVITSFCEGYVKCPDWVNDGVPG